jgi:hypothetical protein
VVLPARLINNDERSIALAPWLHGSNTRRHQSELAVLPRISGPVTNLMAGYNEAWAA